MELSWAIGLILGVVVFMMLVSLAAGPLALLARLLASALAGALVVILLNMMLGWSGFHLPLNPVTAVAVGALGVPGLLAVFLIRTLLV